MYAAVVLASLRGVLGESGVQARCLKLCPPQAEGPESFQLVEVLMGSRQGEW